MGARWLFSSVLLLAAASTPGARQPTVAELNRSGTERLEKGDFAGALKHFEAAARLRPDDPALQFNVGLALFRLGRHREALAPLGKSLAHPASATQARYLRGVIFFELRDFASCAAELSALDGGARYAEHVLYMLVESHRNSGDARRSEEAFVELGKRYPDSAFLHKLMGMAHEWQGNDTKAIESFEQALRANPRMPEMAFAIGYIYFKQHRYEEARAWFDKELGLDPCSAKAHHYLGEIEFVGERIEQAAARYRKAAECDATLGEPYIGLGMVHERRGELEPAVKMYREAVRRKPDDMQARYKLGAALRRTGRREEGDAELAAARKLHEEDSKRREPRKKSAAPSAPE